MATELSDLLPIIILVFVIIAGIWMTVLTYLVIKKTPAKEEKVEEKEEEKNPEKQEEAP